MQLWDSWNSYNDIAEQTGMKRETIIETIAELEKMKLLRKSRRKSKDNKRVFVDNHYFLIVYITGKIRKHCKKIARMYCEYNRTVKLLYKSILLNCNSNTKKSICQVGSKNFFETG